MRWGAVGTNGLPGGLGFGLVFADRVGWGCLIGGALSKRITDQGVVEKKIHYKLMANVFNAFLRQATILFG